MRYDRKNIKKNNIIKLLTDFLGNIFLQNKENKTIL